LCGSGAADQGIHRQSVWFLDLAVYENGSDLLEDAQRTGGFDIYILDIHYHLTNGRIIESNAIRSSFADVMQDVLRDSRFFMCGTSLVVNLHHIHTVDNESLIFDNIYQPPHQSKTAFCLARFLEE